MLPVARAAVCARRPLHVCTLHIFRCMLSPAHCSLFAARGTAARLGASCGRRGFHAPLLRVSTGGVASYALFLLCGHPIRVQVDAFVAAAGGSPPPHTHTHTQIRTHSLTRTHTHAHGRWIPTPADWAEIIIGGSQVSGNQIRDAIRRTAQLTGSVPFSTLKPPEDQCASCRGTGLASQPRSKSPSRTVQYSPRCQSVCAAACGCWCAGTGGTLAGTSAFLREMNPRS